MDNRIKNPRLFASYLKGMVDVMSSEALAEFNKSSPGPVVAMPLTVKEFRGLAEEAVKGVIATLRQKIDSVAGKIDNLERGFLCPR